MWLKHAPPAEEDRSIAVGKAVGIVDAPPIQVCAWFFDFCSRERMRISREVGDPARLVVEERGNHDAVVAAVKTMPFPFSSREFVARQVCAVDETSGGFFVAVVSDSTTAADYGAVMGTVRGATKWIARFEPVPGSQHTQCEVTLHQYLGGGGQIPLWLGSKKLPLALSVVDEARAEFQRNDEIDDAEHAKLAETIRSSPQQCGEEENALVERVKVKLGSFFFSETDFKELPSPDFLVKMNIQFVEGQNGGLLRATAVIDASVEECAAQDLTKMSRAQLNKAPNSGRSFTKAEKGNDHNFVFRYAINLRVPGFATREWVTRVIWKRLDADTTIVCYESIPDHPDYPTTANFVRASFTVYNLYERLEAVGDAVPQTRATWTQQFDWGGVVPKSAVTRAGPKHLARLSAMRKKFDKSLEIDAATRRKNVRRIEEHRDAYSKEEDEALKEGEADFDLFENEKAKKLKMRSPLTKAKIAFKRGSRSGWGWSSTVVRASPEEVLAHMWDRTGRGKRHEDDLEKTIDEEANGHSQLVYFKKRTPIVIANRDFLGRALWKKLAEGRFLLVARPAESEKRPNTDALSSKVVRGKYLSAVKITRINVNETRLEYVIHPSAGGVIPKFIVNKLISSNLANVTAIQEYFQQLRKLEDYDEADGKAVGIRLMHPGGGSSKKKRWQQVAEMVEKHAGLKEAAKEHSWLVGFLEEIARGRLVIAVLAKTVETKLECLSDKEARRMAGSLASALRATKTAEQGVYEWKKRNRSVRELFEKFPWMEATVTAMAREVFKNAAWGLIIRVVVGAGVSILDLASDAFVVKLYLETEGQET